MKSVDSRCAEEVRNLLVGELLHLLGQQGAPLFADDRISQSRSTKYSADRSQSGLAGLAVAPHGTARPSIVIYAAVISGNEPALSEDRPQVVNIKDGATTGHVSAIVHRQLVARTGERILLGLVVGVLHEGVEQLEGVDFGLRRAAEFCVDQFEGLPTPPLVLSLFDV